MIIYSVFKVSIRSEFPCFLPKPSSFNTSPRTLLLSFLLLFLFLLHLLNSFHCLSNLSWGWRPCSWIIFFLCFKLESCLIFIRRSWSWSSSPSRCGGPSRRGPRFRLWRGTWATPGSISTGKPGSEDPLSGGSLSFNSWGILIPSLPRLSSSPSRESSELMFSGFNSRRFRTSLIRLNTAKRDSGPSNIKLWSVIC